MACPQSLFCELRSQLTHAQRGEGGNWDWDTDMLRDEAKIREMITPWVQFNHKRCPHFRVS